MRPGTPTAVPLGEAWLSHTPPSISWSLWLTLPVADAPRSAEQPPAREKVVWIWSYLDGTQALWLRPSTKVSQAEYQEHYTSLSRVRCCPAHHCLRCCQLTTA